MPKTYQIKVHTTLPHLKGDRETFRVNFSELFLSFVRRTRREKARVEISHKIAEPYILIIITDDGNCPKGWMNDFHENLQTPWLGLGANLLISSETDKCEVTIRWPK
ncbi:MAG: hypothetical protein H6581_30995 [Bacteroidia bacterium]|nr:hypothetical protein [Bacteroidia bacterium]